MEWYTVVAALAAVYIPSGIVVWWIFNRSSAYDPYDEQTQRSLRREKEKGKDFYDHDTY